MRGISLHIFFFAKDCRPIDVGVAKGTVFQKITAVGWFQNRRFR